MSRDSALDHLPYEFRERFQGQISWRPAGPSCSLEHLGRGPAAVELSSSVGIKSAAIGLGKVDIPQATNA